MKYRFSAHRTHFFTVFCTIVAILAVARCINPRIAMPRPFNPDATAQAGSPTTQPNGAAQATDSITRHAAHVDSLLLRSRNPLHLLRPDGTPVRNRIISVPRYDTAFPDLNDLQLATATSIGIPHIADRAEAQRRKDQLVYIADNPYYTVEPLRQSIPYLVPRAATLLNTIARAFNDSLVTKGYDPHKLIVTSVLRTRQDVSRLRRLNRNASENSCHQHGTTFDISYNRFIDVSNCSATPDSLGSVHWVTAFKQILAEVLADQRRLGTCYVKYEVKQSCFHITAR